MMDRQKIKTGVYLVSGFILFTILGTLSHEFGHFAVARLLGYEASLHYAYTYYEGDVNVWDSFLITLGGPMQTIFTGTLGFFLALRYLQNTRFSSVLSIKQWLVVFLALFWLRELFNLVHGILIYALTNTFPNHIDEIQLALDLGINEFAIILPAALIACFVLTHIFFKIIPTRQRLLFIISGLIGGLSGFYLWMYLIGPAIMP